MLQFTKRLLPSKYLKVAFYIYFALLFYTTLSPVSQVTSGFLIEFEIPYLDKWVHFIAFTILIILYKLAYPLKSIWIGIGLSIVVGILIELLQEYMNLGRSADIYDIMADFFGIAVGLILIELFNRYSNNKLYT